MLGVALTGVAMASPALAQAADDGSNVGDIVVTARRVEERLQDVPISISVMTQQQLANQNVVDASDLARFTPSLSANTNFGSDNTTFALRGFVQDIGSAPSVGTYFADVVSPRGGFLGFPVGDGAGPGSFFDLQNVQVLKGPQGTLQGRNTTGGAVLLVPTKPKQDFEGYLEGGIGNYGMRNIQGVINVPFGDTFRMRLGIDHMVRDGYLRNTATDALGSHVGPDNYGNVDYTAVRASFVADLSPDLENYTIVSYLDSRTHGNLQKIAAVGVDEATGVPFALGGFAAQQLVRQQAAGDGFYDVRSSFPNAYTKTRQWQIINTTTWQASDSLTVKNIASYAQLTQWQSSPQFGTDFGLGNGVNLYLAGIRSVAGLPNADQSTFTEEFQLQGHNGALTWQGGVYYEQSNPLGLSGVVGPTLLACIGEPANAVCPVSLSPSSGLDYHTSRAKTRDLGLYGQATYAITDRLNLTAGVRYTWDKAEDTSQYLVFNQRLAGGVINTSRAPGTFLCVRADNVDPANCISTLVKKSKAPTWLLSLDYKPVDNVMVYAKWARGYRTGGVYPTAPMGLLTYDPEKVDTFEVGAKTSWNGTVPGAFNVAAFYNNFRDQQLQVGFKSDAAPPTAALFNAGKSRIYGLEADLHVGPFAGFTIDANYAYLNTKVQRFEGIQAGDCFGVGCAVDNPLSYEAVGSVTVGSPLLLAPKHKIAVTGTYTLPLSEDIGTISVGATYTYQSSQLSNYSDAGECWVMQIGDAPTCSNLAQVPSYGLLNLNASWTNVGGRPLDLSFFMTNVTKKKYYAYFAGTLGYGFETATVGAPQMFGVRAKVHF